MHTITYYDNYYIMSNTVNSHMTLHNNINCYDSVWHQAWLVNDMVTCVSWQASIHFSCIVHLHRSLSCVRFLPEDFNKWIRKFRLQFNLILFVRAFNNHHNAAEQKSICRFRFPMSKSRFHVVYMWLAMKRCLWINNNKSNNSNTHFKSLSGR